MIHIIPVTDSRQHIPLSTCECGVKYDAEWDMIVHEAFTDSQQRWIVIPDGDFQYQKIIKELDPTMVKMFKK